MACLCAAPGCDWSVVARQLRLSPRECRVVEGLWHGRKQAMIAAELGISIHTLDTHWRSVKQKLQISPQASAASAAVEVVHRVYGVVMKLREEQQSTF